MVKRLPDKQNPLRAQLEEAGVQKKLAWAATRLGGEIELTIDDLEEFCGTFTPDEIDFITAIPSDERLKSLEKSLQRAHIDLAALAPVLPPSFACHATDVLALDAATLAHAIRACRREIATLRRDLKAARSKANPTERSFRLRWNRFAIDRTGAPLHFLGVTLFNITFGSDVDATSFARMLDRDVRALDEARRVRTGEPQKSC